MRKSDWGTKKGREVVLAIWVKRSFIEDCLGTAVCSNTFGPCCNGSSGGGKSGGGSSRNSRRGRFSAAGGGRGNGSRSPGSACSSPADSAAGSPPQSPTIGPQDHKQLKGTFVVGGGQRSGGGEGGSHASTAAAEAAALLARGRNALGGEDGDFVEAGEGEEVRARALTGGASMQSHFSGGAAAGGPQGGAEGGWKSLGRTASEGGATLGEPDERRPRSHSLSWAPYSRRMTEGVRVHWEPERLPSGEKVRWWRRCAV